MSCSHRHRVESMVAKEDLAAWLRGLADAVAAGELPLEGGAVCLEGCRSLKISLKDAGPQMRAKISLRFHRDAPGAAALEAQGQAAPPEVQDAPVESPEGLTGHPRYKSLKKHMKQTFRAIGQTLAAGELPPALEAGSFIMDARLMVTYAGKGDEFYGAFLEKVEALEAALAARDIQAATALHQDMARIKRQCHSGHA